MRWIGTVVVFVLALSTGSGQVTQKIKGQVLDAESRYPLIGATVSLIVDDDFRGTTTDQNGSFVLSDAPIGRVGLVISYLGYEDVQLPNVLVTSGKEVYLEIELAEQVASLAEVVVKDQSFRHKTVNDLATVSARTFSMDEATRYSGSFGDPARMAQSYAGVSGASDDRNDIIIRGNSPTGVLWRMEGVDILSPNHFATLGTTGGPVSMLNTNNLQNSDFLTSAFPAEYGNATSGVFDLKLRNGNADRYEFLGQIGFNGFEAGIEGPLALGKGSSFMVNGRYSTLGVFGALGIDFGTGSAIPEYQDLTFKINLPTEKLGRFAIWGFGGTSDIMFSAEENGGNNLYNEDDENSTFASRSATIGLTHTYFINERSLTQLSFTYSAAAIEGVIDEFDPDRDLFLKDYEMDFRQSKFSINLKYNNKLSARDRVTAGAILDINGLNVEDSVRLNSGMFRNNIDFDGHVTLYQGYFNWQHRFSDKFTINSGLHSQYLTLNRSFALEPRIGLEFEAGLRHTLSFGVGLHSQTQPIPIYAQIRTDANGNVIDSNEDLDFFKSTHFALGWNWLMAPNWRLKSEIYYQRLSDLAVDKESSTFSLVNTGADFGFPDRIGLDNDGTGRNYGVEFTLEKFFSKGYYVLSTASIFDSKYRGSDEVLRNTLFNSNFVFNVLGGKEFRVSDRWTLTVDGKVTYAGGRRYTPFDVEESMRLGREIHLEDRAFESRLPAYFRPDLKVGFRLNGEKSTQTFFVDLTNFTGNRNVFERDLDVNTGAYDDTYQRGFFPDVRYQITF